MARGQTSGSDRVAIVSSTVNGLSTCDRCASSTCDLPFWSLRRRFC